MNSGHSATCAWQGSWSLPTPLSYLLPAPSLPTSQPPPLAIKMALGAFLHNLDSRQTQPCSLARMACGTTQTHESQEVLLAAP